MIDPFDIKRDTKRVLMFAPAFAPFSFSESITNSKLALAFQAHGWDVNIISKTEVWTHYHTGWHQFWQPLKNAISIIDYPLGNRSERLLDFIRQTIRMNYPIDGVRWAGRAFDRAMKLHKENPYQLVLSRSPSDIGHVPALAFSGQTNVPWIANWNDPPAHLWPEPYKSEVNLFRKLIFKHLMTNVFEEAFAVTFPSERLCKHITRANDKVGNRKVKVIPHIGLPGYLPAKRNADGCFRICHAGNLSRERDPRTFFEGMAQFIKSTSMPHSFEIRIIGTSSHELSILSKQYNIEKYIKFSGELKYPDVLAVLEQSDVLAVVEAPCKEGIFLPSKITDYAQVGRPILAVSPLEGTMADLLSETRAGELGVCNQPESVAMAISVLYKAWLNKNIEQDYPTTILWERFRPENIMRQYEEIYSVLGL